MHAYTKSHLCSTNIWTKFHATKKLKSPQNKENSVKTQRPCFLSTGTGSGALNTAGHFAKEKRIKRCITGTTDKTIQGIFQSLQNAKHSRAIRSEMHFTAEMNYLMRRRSIGR